MSRLIRIIGVGVLAALGSLTLSAEEDLSRPQWWPSPWGAEDQLGAANRLGPDKVLQAAKLITEGAVFDMGRVFEDDMPLFTLTPHHREYALFTPGAPMYGPLGGNGLFWNEDYISGHLGQDGTQFDALAHMGTARGATSDLNNVRYYNGFSHADIGSAHGFSKLGVEQVPPIFTPGILLDIRGLKGRRLERSEEITVADLKAAHGIEFFSLGGGIGIIYQDSLASGNAVSSLPSHQ